MFKQCRIKHSSVNSSQANLAYIVLKKRWLENNSFYFQH